MARSGRTFGRLRSLVDVTVHAIGSDGRRSAALVTARTARETITYVLFERRDDWIAYPRLPRIGMPEGEARSVALSETHLIVATRDGVFTAERRAE